MRYAKRAGCILLVGLMLWIPQSGFGTGYLLVYAIDAGTTGSPPPSTTAYLDGGITNQIFGTENWVLFSGLGSGTHTVQVTTASGYLPRESSSVSNAVNDPDSVYGNPRHVTIVDDETTLCTFVFDPALTASAVVRDSWTMERLENASIEFIVNSGPAQNTVLSNYPWAASYAEHWSTDTTGCTASNTFLFAPYSYNLQITLSDYQSFTSNNVITNLSAGDTVDFGTLFLTPVDNNTNLIADAWETFYFGGSVSAETDADGDGINNHDEYIAGTNPTNALDLLQLHEPVFSNGQLELSWNTESWRTYRVIGTTELCTGSWVQVAGTWEATNGQTEMTWTETNLDLSWNSNYRVEAVPCDWQGTNQVLINTNNWSGGGSGGTNGPPVP